MKCPNCHAENPGTQRFCGGCGTKLDVSEGTPQSGVLSGGTEKLPSAQKIISSRLKDQASVTRTLETGTDELTRGTLFAGRYEIIEELGAGGMGCVYRAFDRKTDEEVALKLVKPEIAADKRIVAAGTAVLIARQVAEGLGEAHRLGVVHRDLKPSNIMIDKDGNAKIMDFGVARSLEGGGTTVGGAIIGTPEYMSPEQVEGKPADQRADIYALGAILFEMVTGQPPFEGETSLAIAHKHKYEPAPDPRALNPQIPQDLSRLILRCLEKEREKRYQTTGELLADLEAVQATLPTTERAQAQRLATGSKPTPSKTITVKIIPKKLVLPVAALIAIVAIVISLGKFLPKKGSQLSQNGPQSIAVLPLTDLSPEKDQAALCEGIAETLLNALANVKEIQVRGRHSSFLFTAQDDPREVGRKLNAEKLLMGSLQKRGTRIRVMVQLINTADGSPLWSEMRDGEMEEIFEIQDMITKTIVSRMNVGLTEGELSRLEKRFHFTWTRLRETRLMSSRMSLWPDVTKASMPILAREIKRKHIAGPKKS